MIRRFYIMPLNHRATPENVAEFIEVYDACDRFIPGLSASAAGLDFGGETVVWENVFDSEETYSGLYMIHPYHGCSLDSYLMADSPELLTHDIFTVRYELPGDIPRIESGIRRLVLMNLSEDTEAAAEKYLAGRAEHVATTVFSRDNVKWVSPKGKAWTHILEQGFADEDARGPLFDAPSLGVHESQSRFWEVRIAHSKPFWKHYFPILRQYFPGQLDRIDLAGFYRAANKIEPGFIRVEADEVCYNLHIVIRFEIEVRIFDGTLSIADIPDAWNELYLKYLGLKVPNDAMGCLQDVHWSFGGMGYFPTYSLGSFFAAQWYLEMNKKQDLKDLITQKKFNQINNWHSVHIHQYGALYNSDELCVKATGKSLDFTCFEQYILEKYQLG